MNAACIHAAHERHVHAFILHVAPPPSRALPNAAPSPFPSQLLLLVLVLPVGVKGGGDALVGGGGEKAGAKTDFFALLWCAQLGGGRARGVNTLCQTALLLFLSPLRLQ